MTEDLKDEICATLAIWWILINFLIMFYYFLGIFRLLRSWSLPDNVFELFTIALGILFCLVQKSRWVQNIIVRKFFKLWDRLFILSTFIGMDC